MMEVKTFYFNPYRECTYVVHIDESTCFIVDPGCYGEKEEQRLLDYLTTQRLQPIAVFITHYHPDHVCGLPFVQVHYPTIPIIDWKTDNLQIYKFTNLQILPTPGHKEDACCFYLPDEKLIFTGDTLFQESIGRTDLPGGDMKQLIQSLEQLKQLDDETIVYPGHGYSTTIGHEKDYNPYL